MFQGAGAGAGASVGAGSEGDSQSSVLIDVEEGDSVLIDIEKDFYKVSMLWPSNWNKCISFDRDYNMVLLP